MSARHEVSWGWFRIPKHRIRNKIQKPGYRERYSAFCLRRGEFAEYNSHGLLVWVTQRSTAEQVPK